MPVLIEHDLLFDSDLYGGPSLSTVDSSHEVNRYFEALATYHDLQPINFGPKEFVYSDGAELNLVLSGEVPTFALIKSETGQVRVSGGDNVLLLSNSATDIFIDGGVTRIFVDAEMAGQINLNVASGEVILDFLHADLSADDDLILAGTNAWLAEFPAKVSVSFKPQSSGSVDLGTLGIKQRTIQPEDFASPVGVDGDNPILITDEHPEEAKDQGDDELLVDWSEHESDQRLFAQADVDISPQVSLSDDLRVEFESFSTDEIIFAEDGVGSSVDQMISAEDKLDSVVDLLAFSSITELVWADAVDVLHDVTVV